MKKFLAALFVLLAAFFFTACGVRDDEEGETAVNDDSDTGGSGEHGGENDG